MKKIIGMICLGFIVMIISGCNASILTKEEAQKKALEEINGEVIGFSKDDDDHYYEFDIVKDNEKFDVKVNARNGEIIEREKDHEYIPKNVVPQTNEKGENVSKNNNPNPKPNNNPQPQTSGITEQEAHEIALAKTNGGNIVRSEIDFDHGTKKYEIQIYNNGIEYEIEINVANGEIIKYEEDRYY